jgi:hypothetical protein
MLCMLSGIACMPARECLPAVGSCKRLAAPRSPSRASRWLTPLTHLYFVVTRGQASAAVFVLCCTAQGHTANFSQHHPDPAVAVVGEQQAHRQPA